MRRLTWARNKGASLLFGRSLASNVVFLGGSRLCAIITNLVITSHLAKALGPANFGLNVFSASYISYFLIVVNLGYETYLTREIAERPARMRILVDSALAVRLQVASVMTVLVVISVYLMDLSPLARLVVLIQATTLFSTAISLSFVYQALQRMQVLAGRDILGNICSMGCILLLVHEPADLPIATAITAGTVLATAGLVLWRYGTEFGAPSLYWPRRFDLAHATRSMSFFWIMLLITVNYATPVVLLGLMRSEAEVGIFSAGWKLLMVTITVPTVISALFLPRFAKLNAHGAERLRLAKIFIETILVWAIPVTLLGIALAPQLVLTLFGASFSGSSSVVRVLLLNALVISINTAVSAPLLAGTRQKDLIRIIAAGTITGAILDLAFIPFWGIDGAAWAALVDEAVIMVLFAARRPEIPLGATISFAVRCCLAALPAAGLAYMMPQLMHASAPPVLVLVTGGIAAGAVYLALLWPMRISFVRLATDLLRIR